MYFHSFPVTIKHMLMALLLRFPNKLLVLIRKLCSSHSSPGHIQGFRISSKGKAAQYYEELPEKSKVSSRLKSKARNFTRMNNTTLRHIRHEIYDCFDGVADALR